MKYYLLAFKNINSSDDRASVKEYWYFVLFNTLFSTIFLAIDIKLGWIKASYIPIGVLNTIYGVICLIPGIMLTIRRLHDSGQRGSMILVGLIPIIGGIWLLVLLLRKGDPEENHYGSPIVETEEETLRLNKQIQTVLIVYLIWIVLNSIEYQIVKRFHSFDYYRSGFYNYYSIFLYSISLITPFLLIALVTNKKIKVILQWIFAIVFLVGIYSFIGSVVESVNRFNNF